MARKHNIRRKLYAEVVLNDVPVYWLSSLNLKNNNMRVIIDFYCLKLTITRIPIALFILQI